MAESFTITSEDRFKRVNHSFLVDDLRLSKGIYAPGYWFVTNYPEPVPCNDLTSRHFIVRGGYSEPTGALPYRGQGWVSSNDPGVIPAGQWRRESAEGCEIWCIRRNQNPELGVDNANIFALEPGQELEVDAGNNVFVCEGVCAIDAKALTQEKLYRVASGRKTIAAQTKVFAIVWPTPST